MVPNLYDISPEPNDETESLHEFIGHQADIQAEMMKEAKRLREENDELRGFLLQIEEMKRQADDEIDSLNSELEMMRLKVKEYDELRSVISLRSATPEGLDELMNDLRKPQLVRQERETKKNIEDDKPPEPKEVQKEIKSPKKKLKKKVSSAVSVQTTR